MLIDDKVCVDHTGRGLLAATGTVAGSKPLVLVGIRMTKRSGAGIRFEGAGYQASPLDQ